MRTVDDFFSNQLVQNLYHYTGIDSLVGISESRCIWASHAYYMNDSEEIIYSCKVLKAILKKRMEIQSSDDEKKEFLGQFLNWSDHFKVTPYNIFVFSLSEEAQLLSQWRSYTPHGKGVSIAFSPDKIKSIVKNNNLRLVKCLYENSEHKEILNSLIEKLLTTFDQNRAVAKQENAHPSQCYHQFLEKFRGNVLQVFSIIKHSAFKEEKEWRLISEYYPNYTVPEIKFRAGASMLAPYIEVNFDENDLLFEKVILGPSQHQKLSQSALSMFLSNKQVCNQVVNSQIPYREW